MTFRQSSRAYSLFVSLFTTFGILAINLVTGVLTARLLGVEGRGVIASVTVWSSVVIHLGEAGGPLGVAYLAASRSISKKQLLESIAYIVVVQSIALGLIGVLLIGLITERSDGPIAVAIVFILFAIPTKLLARYYTGYLQGTGAFGRFSLARASYPLAYCLFLVALFWMDKSSVAAVLVAMALANGVWAGLSYVSLDLRPAFKFVQERQVIRQVFGYGVPAHIGNLAPLDFLQLDLALVTLLLGPQAAGLYVIGLSTSTLLRTASVSLGMVIMPTVAGVQHREDRDKLIGLSSRLNWALGAGMAVILWISLPRLIPLVYGSKFQGSIDISRMLLIGMLIAGSRQLLADALRGAGEPSASTKAEGLALVAFLLASVPGVALSDPVLIAGGTSFAYACAYAYLVLSAKRAGIKPWSLVLLRSDDIRLVVSRLKGLATGT